MRSKALFDRELYRNDLIHLLQIRNKSNEPNIKVFIHMHVYRLLQYFETLQKILYSFTIVLKLSKPHFLIGVEHEEYLTLKE